MEKAIYIIRLGLKATTRLVTKEAGDRIQGEGGLFTLMTRARMKITSD